MFRLEVNAEEGLQLSLLFRQLLKLPCTQQAWNLFYTKLIFRQ